VGKQRVPATEARPLSSSTRPPPEAGGTMCSACACRAAGAPAASRFLLTGHCSASAALRSYRPPPCNLVRPHVRRWQRTMPALPPCASHTRSLSASSACRIGTWRV